MASPKPPKRKASTTSKSPSEPSTKAPKKQPKGADRVKELERNINHITFGADSAVQFDAWYPSWYPAHIIGEKALDGKGTGITVDNLYVCKRCFAYSRELNEWLKHARFCTMEIPGQRIYVHGGLNAEVKRENEGKAYYSVWEVDGAVDKLFCQKLSLFGKMFLDNKSVFYDVEPFKYYLIVFTHGHSPPHPADKPGDQQIIGFFSKEKNSYDKNNLACIVVFPTWQKNGVGNILMGVSYAIARREGIMGGPEKPISPLGQLGYKKYWSTEIARWIFKSSQAYLLSQSSSSSSSQTKKGGKAAKKNKFTFTPRTISEGTWISIEDVVQTMRELGWYEILPGEKGEDGKPKLKITMEGLVEWARMKGVDLSGEAVSEEGFLEGFAVPVVEEEEEEAEGGGVEEEGEVDEVDRV